MLQTESLEKRFGSLTAVNDVSIDGEEGEFRTLIGPNGAGKISFFNLVTGSLPPLTNVGGTGTTDRRRTRRAPRRRPAERRGR